VNTVTTPLSSVDDASSVTTVGGGMIVSKMVVGMIIGMKDDTDDCREGLCDEDSVDVLVLDVLVLDVLVLLEVEVVKEDEDKQLAKSVETGLASVMMLVMIRGTDIVETPPDITVTPVISVEETQIAERVDKHAEDTKVEVVSGSVCTTIENVVTTIFEVTVVNKVRVGVGVHAAMSCW